MLTACGVHHIEFRSIHGTNVLALTDAQLGEFRTLLDGEGFKLSAVGSPVGKQPLDAPFDGVLTKLKRAVEVAQRFGTPNVRVFSFYPPVNGFDDDWTPHRAEVVRRMQALADHAAAAGCVLLHENEHNIYGQAPDRVLDLAKSVRSAGFRLAYDAANYVFCGHDPVVGWEMTKEYTTHLHVKDWKGTGDQTSHRGHRRRRGRADPACHGRHGAAGVPRATPCWSRTSAAAARPAASPGTTCSRWPSRRSRRIVTEAGGKYN